MVVALSIRPVTDPNEITFHMLEARSSFPEILSERRMRYIFK